MEQRFPYSKNKITIVRGDKLEKYLVRKLSLIHDFSIINSHIATILHLQLERSFSILFSIGIKFRNCGKTIVVTRTIPDKIRSIIRLIISIPEEYNHGMVSPFFSLFLFILFVTILFITILYKIRDNYSTFERKLQNINNDQFIPNYPTFISNFFFSFFFFLPFVSI